MYVYVLPALGLPQLVAVPSRTSTVSFHNFKLRVSNPKSKCVAYSSVLYRISNCQGLGRKNKHDILKTDRSSLQNKHRSSDRSSLVVLEDFRTDRSYLVVTYLVTEYFRTDRSSLQNKHRRSAASPGIYIYIYIYVCVHIYIYIHIHTYICIYIYIYIHIPRTVTITIIISGPGSLL